MSLPSRAAIIGRGASRARLLRPAPAVSHCFGRGRAVMAAADTTINSWGQTLGLDVGGVLSSKYGDKKDGHYIHETTAEGAW